MCCTDADMISPGTFFGFSILWFVMSPLLYPPLYADTNRHGEGDI